MPTTKQRITITATGTLEAVLEIERRLHPELTPAELVGLLIERGHSSTLADRTRRQMVEALAGGIHYPDHHLRDLRGEWPD